MGSHSTFFTDRASSAEEIEIPLTRTPGKNTKSGMITEVRGAVGCRLFGAGRRNKKKVHSHRLGDFSSSQNSCTVSFGKPQWIPKYLKLHA